MKYCASRVARVVITLLSHSFRRPPALPTAQASIRRRATPAVWSALLPTATSRSQSGNREQRQSPDRKALHTHAGFAEFHWKLPDRSSHPFALHLARVISVRILRRINQFTRVVSVRIEFDQLKETHADAAIGSAKYCVG
jgi:hypothetical protein